MSAANRELARIFKDMAGIYAFSGEGDRFRVLAYDKAARVLGSLEEDVSKYADSNQLEELPGIGESIAGKIREYLATGKIAMYESLKTTVPHELLEMLDIKGFGPESLKRITAALGISTRDEIIEALQDGRISRLKGFGPKKVANMMKGLKLHKTVEDRMLLWDALQQGESMIELLLQLPEVQKAALAGSLRRGRETIGDIDILVAAKDRYRKKIVDFFIGQNDIRTVLARGDTKLSVVLKDHLRQVDIRLVHRDEWGAALQYFTGSKEHNIHLRSIAREKGLKISEYGVFRLKDNKRLAGKEEEDIYRALDFRWMPPEIREDRGELELAARHKVPRLVEQEDIRGDLHIHSQWSDGMHTIEEIGRHVQKHLPYRYIALTDHSKSSRIAKGMDEHGFLQQLKAIREANERLGADLIKSGAEVDILPDGTLDLSDEVLAQLDIVVAAVHASFNRDNTDRLIRACQNPYVAIIAHPTGRLIGSREAYPIDMRRVIEAARETGTALEINAQPTRMDLNDEWARLARDAGVKLAVSTDTHRLADFNYMKPGILIARRAWCTADDILNTASWKDVEEFIRRKGRK